MAHVYIGLGTNLGDRYRNLKEAQRLICKSGTVLIIKASSIDETEPVDYLEQPHFLNQIIFVETKLLPQKLLSHLQKIENHMGRQKDIPKGPRIIDLDILLYDEIILDTNELMVPHPEIRKRDFILKHLLEIEPEISDPRDNTKYREVYQHGQDKKHQ